MPDVNLELNYDSAEQIPEGFKGLFDEKDGKFVLAGVSGMKTQNDVNAVQEALRKEREDHKNAKDSLSPWTAFGKPEELQAKLDRMSELEAAAEGKLDDKAINGIVEGRLTQKTAPLERQISTFTEENTLLKKENEGLKSLIERRDMSEALRNVAIEMKVIPSAIPDIEIIAASYLEKDTNGKFVVKADAQDVTPGVDIKQFMKEMQKIRRHWWPNSEGGGSGGAGDFGDGGNPWAANSWNMTTQSQVVRDQGMEVAQRMAKAAGTTVGGTKPIAKK